MKKTDELQQAAAAVEEAQREWELAVSTQKEASRAETAAVNRLNEAQKQFDKVIAEFKQKAGGDWHSREG